ncbi:MAG: hypothetical protein RIB80_01010 [Rhodospirillales bacterium]
MKPSLRRAHEVYDRAVQCLAEEGIEPNVRQNLTTAKTTALIARGLYEAGKNIDAAEALALSERILSTAIQQHTWPLAKRGVKFRDGPKGQRFDALGKLIMAALNELGRKASEEDVYQHVIRNGAGVIDEVDAETIDWRTTDGRDKTTSRARFRNRVSEYRKK